MASRRRRGQVGTLRSRRLLRRRRPLTEPATTPRPSIASGGAGEPQRTGAPLIKGHENGVASRSGRGSPSRAAWSREPDGNRWQQCHAGSLQTRNPPGLGVLDTLAEFGGILGEASRPPARHRQLRGLLSRQDPGDRPGGFLGQAVAGGLLFLRGRRLRGAPAATVVAAGLRPRFFSVLPTPASFRSR